MRARVSRIVAFSGPIGDRFSVWALVLFLAACHGSSRETPPAVTREDAGEPVVELTALQLANAGVRTERVAPAAFAPWLTLVATITADAQHLARVGPRVAGRIVNVYVNLGDHVRRGQPLIGIDAIEFHDTSREYFQSSARTRAAELALDRARRLVSEGAGSMAERERAQGIADAERAALHEAEEHLHALGLNDRDIRSLHDSTTHGTVHSRVLAPMDGRVTQLAASIGQVVAGTEDLVVLSDTRTLWVTARVYERDLASVSPGTDVEVVVPGQPGRVYQGTVDFLSDLVDPITHTVEARARLDNPDGSLRPGMTATATLRMRAGTPAVLLPASAVQTVEGHPHVFIEIGPRRFVARPVAVGPEQGGRVPVTSGIAPDEAVVVEGAFALRGEHERAGLEGG